MIKQINLKDNVKINIMEKSCIYLKLDAIFKCVDNSIYKIKNFDDVKDLVLRFIPDAEGVAGLVRDDQFARYYDILFCKEGDIWVPAEAKGCGRMRGIIEEIIKIAGDREKYLITNVTVPCCEANARKRNRLFEFYL